MRKLLSFLIALAKGIKMNLSTKLCIVASEMEIPWNELELTVDLICSWKYMDSLFMIKTDDIAISNLNGSS